MGRSGNALAPRMLLIRLGCFVRAWSGGWVSYAMLCYAVQGKGFCRKGQEDFDGGNLAVCREGKNRGV